MVKVIVPLLFVPFIFPQHCAFSMGVPLPISDDEHPHRVPDMDQAKLFLIGIDDYRKTQYRSLDGAVRDMKDLETFFLCDIGIPNENIRLILGPKRYDQVGPTITKKNIIKSLKSLIDTAKEDEILILGFSGHGDVDSQGNAFLVLQDTQVELTKDERLYFSELMKIFKHEGKPEHRILILDACKSGKIHDLPRKDIIEVFDREFKSSEEGAFRNIVLLSAAQADQSSFEDANGGYFIQALIRGMRGYASTGKQDHKTTRVCVSPQSSIR